MGRLSRGKLGCGEGGDIGNGSAQVGRKRRDQKTNEEMTRETETGNGQGWNQE